VKKALYFFLIIFIHLTALDFFFVNYQGPVFLWDKATELATLTTHFVIALVSCLIFILVEKLLQRK